MTMVRMPYTVRRIGPDDWHDFKTFRLEALQAAPEAFGSTYAAEVVFDDAAWKDKAVRLAESAEAALLVAVDSVGGWVGMMAVYAGQREHPNAVLASVYVRRAVRGGDVARRLHDAALEFARSTPAEGYLLEVRTVNERASRFYEREGWIATGPAVVDHLDTRYMFVTMRHAAFRST